MWIKHTCPQNQFLPFQTIHHYEQDRGCQRHQEENCRCAQGWNELKVQLQETWWKDDSCWFNSLKIEKISNHSIWSFMEDLASWVRMIIRHGRKHCSQKKTKSNFLTLTWPATFRGREMLSMTEGTLTIFVLRVREDQWERPLNRTMYYKFSDENLLPSARTVKMGHGPVLTMTKNTQKAKDEAH